jgi:hypothetical protein
MRLQANELAHDNFAVTPDCDIPSTLTLLTVPTPGGIGRKHRDPSQSCKHCSSDKTTEFFMIWLQMGRDKRELSELPAHLRQQLRIPRLGPCPVASTEGFARLRAMAQEDPQPLSWGREIQPLASPAAHQPETRTSNLSRPPSSDTRLSSQLASVLLPRWGCTAQKQAAGTCLVCSKPASLDCKFQWWTGAVGTHQPSCGSGNYTPRYLSVR